jgi:hypothetical protein
MTNERKKLLRKKLLKLHFKLFLPNFIKSTPFDYKILKKATNQLLKIGGK